METCSNPLTLFHLEVSQVFEKGQEVDLEKVTLCMKKDCVGYSCVKCGFWETSEVFLNRGGLGAASLYTHTSD